jgi:hypothetical protein
MVDEKRAAGGTMSTAAEGVLAGASDARDKARQILPLAEEVLGRSVYRVCYVVSFGIVFPTVLLASFVPTDNALGHGLIEGARAARRAVDKRISGRKALETSGAPDDDEQENERALEADGLSALAPG